MERGISFRSHYTHGMAENTLADFLSAAIKERGWSIRELARRLDISHTHVGRIISGESHPSTSLCYRISDVLQIPYETIMNFEDLRLATVETSDDENVLLHHYRQLSQPMKFYARGVIIALRQIESPDPFDRSVLHSAKLYGETLPEVPMPEDDPAETVN